MYNLRRAPSLRYDYSEKTVPFSIVGNAEQQTYDARKYFVRRSTLVGVKISCGTAPDGSALTLQLLKNGSNFGSTVSVPSTVNYLSVANLSDVINPNDYIQISFTSIGSGTAAADILIELLVS